MHAVSEYIHSRLHPTRKNFFALNLVDFRIINGLGLQGLKWREKKIYTKIFSTTTHTHHAHITHEVERKNLLIVLLIHSTHISFITLTKKYFFFFFLLLLYILTFHTSPLLCPYPHTSTDRVLVYVSVD